MIRNTFIVSFVCGVALLGLSSTSWAQETAVNKKKIQLSAIGAKDFENQLQLLSSEDEQESGNAVPVLLRVVYEQQAFMKTYYPVLNEYADLELTDPKLQKLPFDSFARQIIRAGSMSYADWQYPLRSERPYTILLPDIQSQRQLVGRGMTAWIKQQLAKGDVNEALIGIRAQLGCSRHCAATPVIVCHLVGLSIANLAFDNLELAIQNDECPNMYWSLAALSPTLQDLGPMIRWELWAAPARPNEPVPAIGDERWIAIANTFVDVYAESSGESYSQEEGEKLKRNGEQLAKQELAATVGFTDEEIGQMLPEELIMRLIHLRYYRFRSQVEPLAYQPITKVIEAKKKIEVESKKFLMETGAKSSPLPISLPQGILACRNFERRAKFLQTIESIRDFASKNKGVLPEKLEDLELTAPIDPFTEKPFLYEYKGKTARLSQSEIEGYTTTLYDYELSCM